MALLFTADFNFLVQEHIQYTSRDCDEGFHSYYFDQ
jgi:hypothetical protein